MIKEITEVNFPNYATISSATVTLNDMGDKTISAQIKIYGDIVPDFSYDWEVEFQGEQYINPFRKPQASKGNESICSAIELTFQHWTIYQLKRFYFVKMSEVDSGTVSVDKYISPINLNLGDFCVAFQRVLEYYFNGEINIDLNQDWEYSQEVSNIEISYTHIWDVLQKLYEVYGVRWSIEGKTIKIGYPTEEVEHVFKYGFDGGLLSVERQVQDSNIRNSLLGRGGEKNLPYRYFKDVDPKNPSFQADPDWIPELASIYFSELRGKTFRDYVKGWKAKHYGGEPMQEPTEEYIKGYTDTKFNPIEYVNDEESIVKYGLLQGGLGNQEDIYPSIQGVEVSPYGRIDEVVGVEKILVDEETEYHKVERLSLNVQFEGTQKVNVTNDYLDVSFSTDFFKVPDGYVGKFLVNPTIKTMYKFTYDVEEIHKDEGGRVVYHNTYTESTTWKLGNELMFAQVMNSADSKLNIVSIPSDDSFYVKGDVRCNNLPTKKEEEHKKQYKVNGSWVSVYRYYNPRDYGYLTTTFDWVLDYTPINGVILGNYIDGTDRRFALLNDLESGKTSSVTIQSDSFELDQRGATNVDVPINIITDSNAEGLYEWKRIIEAVNIDTNEIVSSINIPQGRYYLRVKVEITNQSDANQSYKIELMPSYILFPTDVAEYKPTFDIWVKNIWGSVRNEGETDKEYAERVWRPILGDRQGNEAKVVFTTGWLSGHSDYEFPIYDFAYAGDDGVELGGVKAEWKLTLIKSDAEIESTGKWIPSTKQEAIAGDKFFFLGIDMPHQYVLWAEERLDNFKRDELLKTADIKPTWVVKTDKVRLNQMQDGDTNFLIYSIKAGNIVKLSDHRFISIPYENLYIQSVTYSWREDTIILPDVEIVLSDEVYTSINPVAQIQGQVDLLAKQVGSISNIQQIVRAICDKLYLRKDGIREISNSATEFNKQISSVGFDQGFVGGKGWCLREENGQAILEADKVIARSELIVNSIVNNQVAAMGGTFIVSAANMECSKVEDTENAFRCYFDQKQGALPNMFAIGDIAYCQSYSIDNSVNKYYKREVLSVGHNYIDLSKTNYDGDGAAQVGDVIVQFGSFNDTSRQGVIVISSSPTPSITQYENVNSFKLPSPSTKIAPNDNKFSGKVHISEGSTGASNMSDLPNAVQESINDVEFGKFNLLVNSGFTGDYLSAQLNRNSNLGGESEMFSPSLAYWTYENVIAQESVESQSGVELAISDGNISQELKVNIIPNENYVISFKAKGEGITISIGGVQTNVELTNEYERYVERVRTIDATNIFSIVNANCNICDIQLERGTVPSVWGYSMWDNQSSLAYYQSLAYLSNAIKDGGTSILGGLVLANMMLLGNADNGQVEDVTSGISGIKNDDNDISFWGGGTYEQAINTVSKYINDPQYQPSESELKDMANFVVTHGGDVFMRGYIHALGGMFSGEVRIANGKILLKQDGSGHLANNRISWDSNGVIKSYYPMAEVWVWFSEIVDENNVINLDKGGYIDYVVGDLGNNTNLYSLPSNVSDGTTFRTRSRFISRNTSPIAIQCPTNNYFLAELYISDLGLVQKTLDTIVIEPSINMIEVEFTFWDDVWEVRVISGAYLKTATSYPDLNINKEVIVVTNNS